MTLSERLSEYVRAAFSGLWVRSHEPDDAIAELAALCRAESWALATWDVDRGGDGTLEVRRAAAGNAAP